MGGLVARYWVAQAGGADVCRAIITLGTPHRGAPKALDVLANGVSVKGIHLPGTRSVVADWPGFAELLPNYRVIEDVSRPAEPVLRYPHELPQLGSLAEAAFRTHEEIRGGWKSVDIPPAVYPRIGFGHGTLRSATWNGHRLTVGPGPAPISETGAWDDDLGDGTVPSQSGLPYEMSNYGPKTLRVPRRHGVITDLPEVDGILGSLFSSSSLGAYRDDASEPVVLASDVPDLLAAHEAQTCRAVIRTPVGPERQSAASVWLHGKRVDDQPSGQPAFTPVRLEPDGADGFIGSLPGLEPGLYDLSLTAEWTGPDLATTASIQVVDAR